MAVSATAGVVYFELHDTTLTKIGFQHFLDNLEIVLQALDSDNNQTTLLMDNAPFHNGATCGNCAIRYLPPYSPFLNPIENCFSIFKSKIREQLICAKVLIRKD